MSDTDFPVEVVRMRRTLLTLILAAGLAQAADEPPTTWRRYEDGRFRGTVREDGPDRLRFYDERGRYQGRAKRQRDGSWRRYDERGRFEGTAREDAD